MIARSPIRTQLGFVAALPPVLLPVAPVVAALALAALFPLFVLFV